MSGKDHLPNGKFAPGNKASVGNKGGYNGKTPPQTIHELSDELIKWSQDPEACHIKQFCAKHLKTRTWIHALAESHPEIKRALNLARQNVFLNHLKKGLENKWNHGITNRYISFYDKDLIEFENEQERIKRARKDEELQELIINTVNYSRKN